MEETDIRESLDHRREPRLLVCIMQIPPKQLLGLVVQSVSDLVPKYPNGVRGGIAPVRTPPTSRDVPDNFWELFCAWRAGWVSPMTLQIVPTAARHYVQTASRLCPPIGKLE